MEIRHERPMPDMAFRMRAPLGLTLRNGTRFRIEDWSIRGVKVPGLINQDFDDGVLAIPFQGVVLSFPVGLAATDEPDFYEFRQMNGRQRETLALFYRNLLSGKMASTSEMITSLDTPVDLVPMEETEEDLLANQGSKGRRMRKAAMRVALYTTAFVLVFGYLGQIAWARLNTIALDQPRFVADVLTIAAPKPAFVEDIRVAPGEQALAGEVLATLSDPDAQTEMDEIRFQIRAAERERDQIRERIADHQASGAQANLRYVQAFRLETAKLDHGDFIRGSNMDRVVETRDALRAFDLGVSFSPRDYNDVLNQLRALEVERAQSLQLLRRQRSNLSSAMNALVLTAPYDGTVSNIFALEQQYVRPGQDVLMFEADAPRQVRGWLDHRLTGEVFLGQKAQISVNVNGTQTEMPGTVVDLEAGMNPAVPDRFGMMVTVEAVGLDTEQSRALFPVNAPAQVRLHRNLLDWARGE